MNNRKHPIFIGLLLLLLGLGSIFVLKALHFFTSNSPSFLQITVLIICCDIPTIGAVMLFLHFFKPKMK
jgi:uncharacterized membrane protein YoaK (UPF0700 family)